MPPWERGAWRSTRAPTSSRAQRASTRRRTVPPANLCSPSPGTPGRPTKPWSGSKPYSRVVIMDGRTERSAEERGDGPVDAVFKAIESLARSGAELLLFSVNNVTEGTDSQGEVTVRLGRSGRIVNGMGADTDI